MMHDMLEAVREFRTVFDQPIDPVRQTNLVKEEAAELYEAGLSLDADPNLTTMENFLKEIADLMYVLAGTIEQGSVWEDGEYAEAIPQELAVEAAVLVKVCSETIDNASNFFLDDEMILEAFNRIHFSNMSKLDDDGQPIRREDGKILKGPNYQPPHLLDLATKAMARWAQTMQIMEGAIDEDD